MGRIMEMYILTYNNLYARVKKLYEYIRESIMIYNPMSNSRLVYTCQEVTWV